MAVDHTLDGVPIGGPHGLPLPGGDGGGTLSELDAPSPLRNASMDPYFSGPGPAYSGSPVAEEAQISRELYNEYHAEQMEWAEQAVEDDAYRNGEQFHPEVKAALEARGQSAEPWNVLAPLVEHAVAMLTENEPRFQSTAREDSDSKAGNMFADILSWIWYVSDGNAHLKQAIDDYYARGGRGVMEVYVDPHADFGKGEVLVQSVDPLTVYPDPESSDRYWRDAKHILRGRMVQRGVLLRMMPEYSDAIMAADPGEDEHLIGQVRSHEDGIQPAHEHDRHPPSPVRLFLLDRYTKIRVPLHRIFDEATGREYVLNDEQFIEWGREPAAVVTTMDGSEPVTLPMEIDVLKEIGAQVLGEPVSHSPELGFPREFTFHHREGEPMQDQMGMPVPGEPVLTPGPEEGTPGEIPGSTTHVRLMTREEMTREEVSPFIPQRILQNRVRHVVTVGNTLLWDRVLPISEYPLIPLNNRHNRNPYPISDVRFVRPLQDQINKQQSLVIAHAASATNVKVLLPKGSVTNRAAFEENFNRPGMAIEEYDPELGAPTIVAPVPLPAELYANVDRAISMVERILGIFGSSQGDPGSAPDTFRALVSLDEYAQRRVKGKLNDIEGSLNQLGRVAIEFVQATYTERKAIRLLQPGGGMKELTLNDPVYDDYGTLIGLLNDPTVGRYDVQVVSGSTLPSNRWARLEIYKELYQMGIVDQLEVLKKTDVADHQQVMERVGVMQQQAQMIEQLQEEVKKLQGDLQTREREVYHATMRAEVEKGKRSIQATAAKMDKAGQLFESRLQDRLQQVKAEGEMAIKEMKLRNQTN